MDFLSFSDILNQFYFENYNGEFIDEYDGLQVGDIIFAKRYINEEERLEIPQGHRIGPYIVVGRDNDKFICLYVSGTVPKYDSFDHKTLVLDNPGYSLSKISFIYITKYDYISRDRFIKKIGYLNENDTKKLFKKLDIVKKKGMFVDTNINISNIPLEVGDIINYNGELYLIVNETERKYQCIKMIKKSVNSNFFITLDNVRYSFDFDNLINYSKILEPIRCNFLDNKVLHSVLIKYQEKLNLLKRSLEINRGSLIKINDIYYYVYGETGNFWMAFEVSTKVQKKWCNLVIGKKHYYTDFSNTIKFSKDQKDIEIITVASEEQMTNIKNLKKSYVKNLQSNTKKISGNNERIIVNNDIQPGSIVKFAKTDTGYLHIVVVRNNNELMTVRYDKYLQGEYLFDVFLAEQMELWGNLNNFDLMQLLIDVRDKIDKKSNRRIITKVINELEDIDRNNDNLSQDECKFEIVKKLIPYN